MCARIIQYDTVEYRFVQAALALFGLTADWFLLEADFRLIRPRSVRLVVLLVFLLQYRQLLAHRTVWLHFIVIRHLTAGDAKENERERLLNESNEDQKG